MFDVTKWDISKQRQILLILQFALWKRESWGSMREENRGGTTELFQRPVNVPGIITQKNSHTAGLACLSDQRLVKLMRMFPQAHPLPDAGSQVMLDPGVWGFAFRLGSLHNGVCSPRAFFHKHSETRPPWQGPHIAQLQETPFTRM